MPQIAVAEESPTTYKVSFKTDTNEIISPNLKSNIQAYNVNLAASGRTTDIPLGQLILTAEYAATNAIRLSIRSKNTSVAVLADIRRTTIYAGGVIEVQTFDNTKITTRLVLDDTVYAQSDETHWMRIRQQDPTTSLWSMCEVLTFSSAGSARTSICVNWLYTGASFQAP